MMGFLLSGVGIWASMDPKHLVPRFWDDGVVGLSFSVSSCSFVVLPSYLSASSSVAQFGTWLYSKLIRRPEK
ncbi:hypothetical protein [Pseudoalteromonas citrea]|uniref:hypothetical protein n=1 Tax=Pseudoalteromonas citrea TaxID=43655 RepID=UPI00110AE112|nr:hypothetical protein [Pseudoalteromonas citrea]